MPVQRWRTTALACQSLMFQRVGGGDESSPRRRKGAWQESAMCVSGVGVVRRPRRIGSPTGSRSSVLPSGPLLLPTPSVFAAAFCVVVRQLALRFRVFKHLPTRATAGRTEGGRGISVHLHFLWPVGIRSRALNRLNRQNSKCAVQNQPLRDEAHGLRRTSRPARTGRHPALQYPCERARGSAEIHVKPAAGGPVRWNQPERSLLVCQAAPAGEIKRQIIASADPCPCRPEQKLFSGMLKPMRFSL